MAGSSTDWGQLWGTCGDNDNGGNYFMGPTLYSAELDIFGGMNQQTGLGSHLDMLHSTSFCRGIAWAGSGNQYFVFNSFKKSIDYYDFVVDHGPGFDDHSDGRIRRYWNNQVKGVDGVMSHVAWNSDDKKLYVADTGNKRILVLDPSEGEETAPMEGNEPIIQRSYYEAPVKVLMAGGVLQQPSGIEASGGLAFVTDAKTSMIHAIEIATGGVIRSLDTGLPPGSLAGLNFGPDGKIYFVDRIGSKVYRVDP
jgi:DNA-binding beta-propeller fold protein YncE